MHDVEELMGVEGTIHRRYYASWQSVFIPDVDFSKRVRRPPDNMVNTLISFLNGLMYTTCLSEIYVTQLNPTISYLHSPMDRRFSLCLDISEIFKPMIVDRLIFSLINKNMISEEDFNKESNYCYLSEKSKRIIVSEYDKYMKQKVRYKTLHRDVSYRHLIRLECYKLVRSLVEGETYEPYVMGW
ncbi:CRISPR-associated endonuclease Cas1 [Lactobacillus helveticus]|nr:CRISPR-associated endonuclease Cas1 [Lactobacillus helveticus]